MPASPRSAASWTFALVVCLAPTAIASAGSVLFVDDDAPPRGDGASWRTAFRFLQDALTAAANPRRGVSEIHVAQGTYLPDRDEVTPNGSGDPNDSFSLIDGVALRGGYAGLAGPDPDQRDPDNFTSLLNGYIQEPDPAPDSDCFVPHDGHACDSAACMDVVCRYWAPYCCSPLFSWDLLCAQLASLHCHEPPLPSPPVASGHIITASGVGRSAVLDGFVISSVCVVPIGEPTDWFGRGMYLTSSSPTISQCRFENNFAVAAYPYHGFGGALAAFGGSPLIMNCRFKMNSAGTEGGAMYAHDSDLTIEQCTFEDNLALVFGGSIRAIGGTLRISRSTFRFSPAIDYYEAPYSGGAISHSQGELRIEDSLFDSLSSRDPGGAVSCLSDRILISRSIFRSNQANQGGALWVSANADALISHCEFFF